MPPIFQTAYTRVTNAYGAQTGQEPAALPPGIGAVLLQLITSLLPLLLGTCKGTGTPPTSGAAAMVEHCKANTWEAHFAIRRAIRQNGGLEPGMRMVPTVQAIIAAGAASTPDEVNQLANASE